MPQAFQTINNLVISNNFYQQINRDIGVADLGSDIQIHIQGPDETGPYYFPSTGTVEDLVQQGVEDAYGELCGRSGPTGS